jgi:hypothetical protein
MYEDLELKIVYDEDGEFVYADPADEDSYREGWDSEHADDEPLTAEEEASLHRLADRIIDPLVQPLDTTL